MNEIATILNFLEGLGPKAAPLIAAIEKFVADCETFYTSIVGIFGQPVIPPAKAELVNDPHLFARTEAIFGNGAFIQLLMKYGPGILALLEQWGIIPKPAA